MDTATTTTTTTTTNNNRDISEVSTWICSLVKERTPERVDGVPMDLHALLPSISQKDCDTVGDAIKTAENNPVTSGGSSSNIVIVIVVTLFQEINGYQSVVKVLDLVND
jgi:hypothetical protein